LVSRLLSYLSDWGCSGIGEATAIHLAHQGAKLVLGARGLQRLKSVAQRIEQINENVAFKETDVRRRDHLTSLVDLALSKFGKLDVLINNAGIGPISPLDNLRVDDWDDMIDVKLERNALRNRSGSSCFPEIRIWSLHQHHLHSRTQNCSDDGRIRGDQEHPLQTRMATEAAKVMFESFPAEATSFWRFNQFSSLRASLKFRRALCQTSSQGLRDFVQPLLPLL
jgi:NAD(P)-dependent dehydrogenase (short-subunit alcohol dehydrogenase family)